MIVRIFGLALLGLAATACVHNANATTSADDLSINQPASSEEEIAAATTTADAENPASHIDTANGIPEVEGPFVWGDNLAVKKFDRFYIAGQPDAAAFDTAKTEDIYVVVNLREPNEMTWDEEAYVKKLGMVYYNVPVATENGVDTSVFADIDEIQARHNGKLLIHDSTGNRAAAWFASHLATEQSLTLEKSLEIGKSLGLSGDKNIEEVQSYIASYEEDDRAAASDDSSADEHVNDDSETMEE